METAFFRFYNGKDDKKVVVSTSLISILGSTLGFALLAFLLESKLVATTGIDAEYIRYTILIIALDALVIIPFAWLRANEKAMRYAIVKILNVGVNLGLNVFFLLLLPKMSANSESFLSGLYRADFEISYIFISNLIASALTLMLMLKLYLRKDYYFDKDLWKRMMRYAWPVLVAGIAFTVNEVFDRILLEHLLPEEIAKSEVGKYSACYKLGMFMTLFGTAFRMGIEPFFFSHAGSENPQKAYARLLIILLSWEVLFYYR